MRQSVIDAALFRAHDRKYILPIPMVELSESDLLAFEDDIANEFSAGNIKAPVHLSGGNERQLINIFRNIKSYDWVLCGWRSHYHCLLKGVPPDELKDSIMAGRSVSLCFPSHKILCSGIVGGIAPIAVGLAWAAKIRANDDYTGNSERVHCFLGDMSAESGIVSESVRYAAGHNLNINWIVEDNGLSVCSPTQESWGSRREIPDSMYYSYKMTRPHCGVGKWVRF